MSEGAEPVEIFHARTNKLFAANSPSILYKTYSCMTSMICTNCATAGTLYNDVFSLFFRKKWVCCTFLSCNTIPHLYAFVNDLLDDLLLSLFQLSSIGMLSIAWAPPLVAQKWALTAHHSQVVGQKVDRLRVTKSSCPFFAILDRVDPSRSWFDFLLESNNALR